MDQNEALDDDFGDHFGRYLVSKASSPTQIIDEQCLKHTKSCTSNSVAFGCSRQSGAALWKHALKKMRSLQLDPWHDFSVGHTLPRTATRHRYSAIKKKWVVDEIQVKIEPLPFDHGAMRECFRMKKLSQTGAHAGDLHFASNYVAKRYITPVDKHVYFDDVRLQMEAKLWGEAFNRQNPPKKVDIFQLSVLELKDVELDGAAASCAPAGFYHIERFMEGEYRKYNSNSGFVDEQLRNTPQAFSHFTFERSGHRLLVVDIQGVGDLYTDPQIHTSDGVGYSDGNLGPRGMALFFHSHRCNPLCEWLGLAPFDLATSEIAVQLQSLADNEQNNPQAVVVDAAAPKQVAIEPEEMSSTPTKREQEPGKKVLSTPAQQDNHAASVLPTRMPKVGGRRRTVSLNQPSVSSSPNKLFGPTVVRFNEGLPSPSTQQRLRHRSVSMSTSYEDPGKYCCLSTSLMRATSSDLNSLGPKQPSISSIAAVTELVLEAKADVVDSWGKSLGVTSTFGNGLPRPLVSLEDDSAVAIVNTVLPRNRAASGDSGYSYRFGLCHPLNLTVAPEDVTPDLCQSVQPSCSLVNGSASSLIDLSSPTSPLVSCGPWVASSGFSLSGSVHSAGDELVSPISFSHASSFLWHPQSRLAMGRRQRNLSESSDLDLEEDHRIMGHTLHQLMHESHKPSCADHPTNLDQEIGQSILGQIHHELARLHEAGRFLPGRRGGWSHAGLGGVLRKELNDAKSPDDGAMEECYSDSGTESVAASPLPIYSMTASIASQVDWPAVLFHERHAAQLGCLEAMIVMAHYYVGLPSPLLSDCPLKANTTDVRLGVDYLWRAAEGGDRRCMILLARYLDMSAGLKDPTFKANMMTTSSDLLILPALCSFTTDNTEESATNLPPVAPDSWAEAVTWYKKAVDAAGVAFSSDGTVDEGLDAEGRYDAAEDLLPVYRILARMAEMYAIGGHGLKLDASMSGDLFTQAGEMASTARQGRLAVKYFELADEMYAAVE